EFSILELFLYITSSFFFQAEDGIRDFHVTGVQTCALPIYWHTCYEPPQTVAAPHIGSWIAQELGPKNPVIPAFINIGQRMTVGEAEELKAFHTAGILGSEFGPFMIADPSSGLDSVKAPAGMSFSRFERRNQLYNELLGKNAIGDLGSDYQKESFRRSMEQAYRLLKSPEAKAFDLSEEPKE